MKKFHKFIFILLPFSILFSSCIDITRNIKLNSDGSGHEVMKIELAHSFFQMINDLSALDSTKKKPDFDDNEIISKIKDNLDETKIITINDVTSKWNADSSKTFNLDFNFKDISAIASAFDGGEISGSEKKSDATMKEQDGKIMFNYSLTSDKIPQDTASANLSKVMFGNKKYILTIEFPFDVITSNAQITEGRKLTWEMPMNALAENPKVEFTAELKK